MGQAREREGWGGGGEGLREEKTGRRGKERKEKREEGRYDKLGKKWMIPNRFSHIHMGHAASNM